MGSILRIFKGSRKEGKVMVNPLGHRTRPCSLLVLIVQVIKPSCYPPSYSPLHLFFSLNYYYMHTTTRGDIH